jgi:hypothetical protein
MLRYVQANGDTFVRHINDIEPTRWDEDNFCFARKLTPEQAEQFGVTKLKIVTPPYFDPATQRRDEGPALLVNGVWTQNYIVSQLTPEEAAAKAEEQGRIVRAERDRLLQRTDWTQVDDTPLDNVAKNAWANYRQALRDVPDQAGFPFDVNWPSVPV